MGAPVLKEPSFFEEYVGTCFVNACVKTTETYFEVPAVISRHVIAADLDVPYEVGGFVNFTADNIEVQLVLAFEKSFAVAIYNKMLSEEKTEINEDVLDCLAELTNIIYGMAKAPLVDKGHDFATARPKYTSDVNSLLKGKKSLEIKFHVDKEAPRFSLILSL